MQFSLLSSAANMAAPPIKSLLFFSSFSLRDADILKTATRVSQLKELGYQFGMRCCWYRRYRDIVVGIGKSCRLRWINYLRPDLKHGNFTEEEDELIIKLHSLLGNKWYLIAGRLPERTNNEIKNYWNTHIRMKLLTRGIDHATHRPLNETPTTQDSSTTTTTISFAASSAIKEEDQKISTSIEIVSSKKSAQEKCPDLNLEFRISLPSQTKPFDQSLKSGRRGVYFCCSLGLKDSKSCSSCGIDNIGATSVGTSNIAYDFLGLKNGVLDYRSLEMK